MDSGRRSRSGSRDRDSRRRHKKVHRHKRRSRTRSRSRSYERNGTAGIHINPAFGLPPGTVQPQPMGYSASQLLQTNNMLEAEIHRLKAALNAAQGGQQIEAQRCQMLQQELRNAQIQRDQANKRCNEIMSERRMMNDSKVEMANRINGLEVANRMLRDDVTQARNATEAKEEEIRAITYQSEIVRQQINALNERNAALKTKCETVVAQNRQQHEEMEARQKFVQGAQLNVKKAEADLQLANAEIQRLLRELDSSQQLENSSITDKRNIEEELIRKEDEIRLANYKSATLLKAANDKIEKLELRLKQEKPAVHNEMTVETIYIAIETIKTTYEKQLSRMEEEIEHLKAEKLKQEQQQIMMEEEEDAVVQNLEELPAYLKTPMRPDPTKMEGLKKTIQVKIRLDEEPERPARPASGPPVDSPVTWHQRKPFERLPAMVVPLFGTTEAPSTGPGPSISSEDLITSSTIESTSDEISIAACNQFSEEDLLLAEPTDMISPSQLLDLDEQTLLGGE
ncbi:Trichohyalin [Caenorhabditis elegans]|uniref:Trichohyalin n=1 Tax=Caenorhabditis elegans TaxID=6239 RepID=Q2XMY3_CAEEL|nr:Trichohyalin [Caenorhabditis elegans]CAJ43914.1 Trichohyalin [Caenorhabditis elegans]|eukprot:NP_001041180.1 Uncharacterized protein CELE_W08G11.3 [Caenorhabditis elegans]